MAPIRTKILLRNFIQSYHEHEQIVKPRLRCNCRDIQSLLELAENIQSTIHHRRKKATTRKIREKTQI